MTEPRNRPESSRDGRRARALRENLKRRKAQARGRADGEKNQGAVQEPRDLSPDSSPSGRQNGFADKD